MSQDKTRGQKLVEAIAPPEMIACYNACKAIGPPLAVAEGLGELVEAVEHHAFILDWYYNDNRPGNPLNHEQVIRETAHSMKVAIDALKAIRGE